MGRGGGRDDRAERGEGDGEWTSDATTQGGAVYPSPDADGGAVALWEEYEDEYKEEYEEEEEEEEGDCDLFGSVSWNSYTSGVFDSPGASLPRADFPSCRPPAVESEAATQQDRRLLLPKKRSSQELTMDMAMECADWLKVNGVRGKGRDRKSRS